jgi:ketohexokinase
MDMDEMTLQDFNSHANQLEGDSRDKWFHFEVSHGIMAVCITQIRSNGAQGRSPEVTRCIKLLRDDVRYKSCKISVELEKPDRGFLVEAARHADVVFYSKIWAEVGTFRRTLRLPMYY